MSAIISAKDGYGWDIDCSIADEKGMYFNSTAVKTIYVDEQKISPAYIYWQCRVYNADTSAASISVNVTGLLNTAGGVIQSTNISIPGSGSTLFTIEGYATGDVTVSFPCATNIHIYPMNELGV